MEKSKPKTKSQAVKNKQNSEEANQVRKDCVIVPDNLVETYSTNSLNFVSDSIETEDSSSENAAVNLYDIPNRLYPCGKLKCYSADIDQIEQDLSQGVDLEQLEKDLSTIEFDKTIKAVKEHPFIALGYILELPFRKVYKWFQKMFK